MPLELPDGSRFGRSANDGIPINLRSEFESLIGRIAAQGDRQSIFEHFKGYFCGSIGAAHYRSTSESWAYTDLQRYMEEAANNAALFIEAFYDACETLKMQGRYELPDVHFLNELLRSHNVNLQIEPPRLLRVGSVPRVPAPEPTPTLTEEAGKIVKRSMQRAEDLLAESRPREAVQEMLWILESIATTFRGITLTTGTIEGRYFNEIAKELRRASRGTTLERVIDWSTQLHGYLSSPTGGGVRHGMDIASEMEMSPADGRLFCNLVLSYVIYLMAEHARLSTD